MEAPEVRYARSGAVNIAYQVVGAGPAAHGGGGHDVDDFRIGEAQVAEALNFGLGENNVADAPVTVAAG